VSDLFPDVRIIDLKQHHDERGRFIETYREVSAADGKRYVQDNVSFSFKNVLRGLHYQPGVAKLVQCISGAIWDVVVDVREDSPTRYRWQSFDLDRPERQLYIPDGFAHGFFALSNATVFYKQTAYWNPDRERALRWNDPVIGIQWPPMRVMPRLSDRDATHPYLENTRCDS
jgi:dTDP-4-dehydrorhamnose 3,5-epimerase